jgi:hypothetical protein
MQLEQPNFAPPRALESPRADFSRVSYGNSHENNGLDGGLIVDFYVKPYFMEYLSESMGHPIFQDRIWVRIVAPGNSRTVWDTLAAGIDYETAVDPDSGEYHTTWEPKEILANGGPSDPNKYPNAWARFMKRGAPSEMGWPIEEWGAISRSYAESLKMLNVPTVEALAGLTDANAANIMGGVKYRDLAKASLSERARNQILAQEQAKATRAEDQIQIQNDQIEQLKATIAQMQQQFAQNLGATPTPAQVTGKPQLKKSSVKQSARTRAVLAQSEDAAA